MSEIHVKSKNKNAQTVNFFSECTLAMSIITDDISNMKFNRVNISYRTQSIQKTFTFFIERVICSFTLYITDSIPKELIFATKNSSISHSRWHVSRSLINFVNRQIYVDVQCDNIDREELMDMWQYFVCCVKN